MTRNLDDLLDIWLDKGPTAAPQRVAEAARLQVRSTQQATAMPGALRWRIPIRNTTAAVIATAAAVLVAATVGYSSLVAPLGGPSVLPEADAALPITELDLEPKPGSIEDWLGQTKGPVIQVASGFVSGEQFSVTVFRDAERDGVCVWLEMTQQGGGGCGPVPGAGLPEFGRFGGIGRSELTNGVWAIDGIVAGEVERVWVVTDDGRRANALLAPFRLDDIDASAFLVVLQGGAEPATLVAADGAGAVLDEIPLDLVEPVAPGGDGPLPTPGG